MTKRDRTVLVVDDDREIREAIRDTVADEGYDVIEARDGSEALAYLRSHDAPPLILLDWNMAPMSGPAFMQAFTSDPMLEKVPVVLLTADAHARAKAANGYAGYLQKPVSLDALFQVLERYCT